jgi:starvation-inducible DNA-binding protein
MTTTLKQSTTITELKNSLADTYTLLLKTHNYHWNVTGPNFFSLHTLFEGQYNELFLAVDEIAERIRALGEKAPGSFSEFSRLTDIAEADSSLDADAMIKDLYNSNELIIETLIELRDVADSENDRETEDIAIARIKVHQKNAWMLKASK